MIYGKLRWIGLGSLTMLALGCGHRTQSAKPGQNAIPTDDGWTLTHYASPDGSVRVTKSDITQARLEDARNQYRRANLVQIPVDAKYNATVLRITDATVDDYKNKAFITPRLFSYGTQDGGKLAPIRHPDGTVTLAFNIAFLDGITRKLLKPASDGSVTDVPELYAVKSPDELSQLLKNQYGTDNGLAALPGCPKQLTLVAAGKDYDVTPSDFARADYCQLNTPTTVSLTVPESDAQLILENALESNTVDLRGVFETKVSYPTSKISIEFDREKIYSDLRAELGVKIAFADADVQLAIKKVMEDQIMEVSIQGAMDNAKLNDLIMRVSNEFFEPWKTTPEIKQTPCGAAPVCLRFGLVKTSEEKTLKFSWANDSNLMSGQNYITTTKLKATPNSALIGDASPNCETTRGHTCTPALSNRDPARETGLTVVSGNLVQIEPTYIIRERRDFGFQPTVRHDHPVCTEIYHWIHDICMKGEHQWQDITDYYQHDLPPETITDPIGQIPVLFEGLFLEFHFMNQATKTQQIVSCALSSFPMEGDGSTLKVRVQNMPSCKPFTGKEGETPLLYLSNRISYLETYLAGRKVVNWNGTVPENPSSQTFNPIVQFGGKISILGYGFESAHEATF